VPTYIYKNLTTGEVFEVQQRMSEDALTVHPESGDPVKKLVSAPAIAFRGSGFYANDSRASKSGGKAKSEDSSTDSGSDSGPKSDSSGPESSKSDSGKADSSAKTESKSSESASSSTPAPSSTPSPATTPAAPKQANSSKTG